MHFCRSFLMFKKCNWAPPSPIPTRWTDLQSFFLDFPWIASWFSSRDASVVADSASIVVKTGMESCIPCITKSTTSAKWFDCSCSDAIEERDRAYRTWKQHPNPTSQRNFIFARNRTKRIIRRVKRAFIKRKCADLSDSSISKILWSLTS